MLGVGLSQGGSVVCAWCGVFSKVEDKGFSQGGSVCIVVGLIRHKVEDVGSAECFLRIISKKCTKWMCLIYVSYWQRVRILC